jgi:predicted metal-binding protein
VTSESADLHVCITCQSDASAPERPGMALYKAMTQRVADGRCAPVRVHPVECMGVCVRPCTIAVSSPEQWSYVIGDIDPVADIDALCRFLGNYIREGTSPYQETKALSAGTMARIPPVK